ncbi:MAG: ASCH domain-containing protein [Rhodanobacter sp.]
MLALSIVAPNGANIAAGRKTLEIRSWQPPQLPLRDLLIIENRRFLTGVDETDPDGFAVAMVDVEAIHAWQPSELVSACATEWVAHRWAWQITRVRPLSGVWRLPARRKLYEVEVSATMLDCLRSV